MEAAPATIENSGVSARSNQLPAQLDVNGGGDDGGSIGGGFAEDVERNSGGNRWPKQETLALIRIRSEMDAAFRDSNLKGPLWDEVSRKLSELGFHRNAKKCREKFENVYKYHRRTKEGRTSKSDKIYRFSDQLQALESIHRGAFPPPPALAVKPPQVYVAMSNNPTIPSPYNGAGLDQNNASPISVAAPAGVTMPPPMLNHKRAFPFSQPNQSESTDSGSSSDTSDDEPPHKKRKWEDFFEKLMKELIDKQEELQMKFLDTLDIRERDRVAKEEAWRAQEIAKMNQEHDRLVKERSMVAAKDAAIATFLQKLIGKSVDVVVPVTGDDAREKITDVPQQETPPSPPAHQPSPPPSAAPPPPPPANNLDTGVRGEENATPSRWPKAEIDALITLRSQLDVKYQENVPKGPLWEEISAAMKNLGYHRNAKRCKEKWENINKYYKKIKESNKKRPEDSKTCPYFDQLDALYRRKSTPIIAQSEQQWPPATEKPPPPPVENMEDQGSEEFDDFDDGDEGGACAYEIVSSKVSSI
ncbi:hypothetical protein L1987_23411 [Smallanthus sonchifolius]|uniref:Uncharacterized protein n=1 Tax=Smallanthus sonchifolius TaxID=185202 RepID=A0ACB9IJ18_9ASTR|nr:hypothetical protein L1987_23411 [Smallanthus sonchifolius]